MEIIEQTINLKLCEVRRILVLGLGISGLAAAELAVAKGFDVVALDESETLRSDFAKFAEKSDTVSVITGFKGDVLPDADLIVISPGIPQSSKIRRLVELSGLPVLSELAFGAEFAKNPVLAVTGTNGKTTVTEMTSLILGERGCACGNIGYPLSRAVLNSEADFFVAEVSSFQLEYADSFSSLAAVITNIESDHIDRYANFAEYRETKFKLLRQTSDLHSTLIHCSQFKNFRIEDTVNSYPLTFSATDAASDIKMKSESVVDFSSIGIECVDISGSAITARHNIENFMAAVFLASNVLSERELTNGISRLLNNFSLSPHRQEIILEKDGILYVNDSKATNPASVAAALDVFGGEGNVCLIAGGLDKDMDFSLLSDYYSCMKKCFLIGDSRDKIAKMLTGLCSYEMFESFEDAVLNSVATALPGDVVLLSPGCASMDMFSNYKERGDTFRGIILQSLS